MEDVTTQSSRETGDVHDASYLVLRSALPGDETSLVLEVERAVVGRGQACDMRLETRQASRSHAEVCRRGRLVTIRDLSSANGTFVDGERVEHRSLASGAVIRLGEWLGVVEELRAEDQPFRFRELAPELWGGPILARAMRPLMSSIGSNVPVVLVGETGTGKERVARALHAMRGGQRPFHAVNCAALPQALAEAELFGYRKGAFTGAERGYEGHLRAAHGGTLFLDEVADLALPLQAKLLRALDTGELAPLGDTSRTTFAAQVVVATQKPLSSLVEAGHFRADLAARLSCVAIALPALRERRADIPSLFERLLAAHSGCTAPPVSPRLYECLCLHDWPGNVRELEMLARQLLAVHGLERVLSRSHLPSAISAASARRAPGGDTVRGARSGSDADVLRRALETAGGNVRKAAQIAGMSRQKAYRVIASRGLKSLRAGAERREVEHEPGD